MTARNFSRALEIVLRHEGGYANHPKDPGGATMKGVIQVVYTAYRKRKGLPNKSVRFISNDELHDIYKTQYWDVARCDLLPPGVDYAVFDYNVNSGPGRGIPELQRVVGVDADGVVGNVTLAAVTDMPPKKIIEMLCDRRLAFLKRLGHWPTFGKGWARRVDEVRRVASEWAVETEPKGPPAPPDVEPLPPKPETKSPGVGLATGIALAFAGAVGAILNWFGVF